MHHQWNSAQWKLYTYLSVSFALLSRKNDARQILIYFVTVMITNTVRLALTGWGFEGPGSTLECPRALHSLRYLSRHAH